MEKFVLLLLLEDILLVWIFQKEDTEQLPRKNSGNIYNKYYTFDEDLDAEDDDSPKIHKRLIIGDILFITDALVVELSSKKANLLQNIIRYPIGKEITLKAGNYICGDDFKSGVYDIKRIKNRGVVFLMIVEKLLVVKIMS